jgi:cytoskeletal protein RodZ
VLTVGDYLLWNWSLQGGHDVTALVSGLTLPPLVIALIWLGALNLARLLAWTARRQQRTTATRSAVGSAPRARDRMAPASEGPLTDRQEEQTAPSSKLAA